MPTSMPQPAASGLASSKARRVRQRWPDSGACGVQPVSSVMPRRAVPITRPIPPACWPSAVCCGGRTAMASAARPDTTASTSGAQRAAEAPRSASSSSSVPTSGSRSRCSTTPRPLTADSTAAALPRLRSCETTIAPAAAACAAVASELPSSQTMTTSTPGSARAAVTVAPTRSCSSLAGMMHATRARPEVTAPRVVPGPVRAAGAQRVEPGAAQPRRRVPERAREPPHDPARARPVAPPLDAAAQAERADRPAERVRGEPGRPAVRRQHVAARRLLEVGDGEAVEDLAVRVDPSRRARSGSASSADDRGGERLRARARPPASRRPRARIRSRGP